MRFAANLLFLICLVTPSSFGAMPSTTRILRVRALGEPQTLDWNRASTWLEDFVIRNLMRGLVQVGPDLKGRADLAEGWSSSPDHRVWTFKLRKNVKWSDGVPLKARDFIEGWKRLLTPNMNAKYAFFLFDVEGAEAFHSGQLKDFSQVGIREIDDHTLQVKLRSGVSYWHLLTSFYVLFPIRRDLIDKDPDSWEKVGHLVSLGAFTLKSFDPGRSMTLARNPHYPNDIKIDELDIALVHDDSTALKYYNAGKLDLLARISSLERRHQQTRPDFKTWPDLRVIHLRVNTKSGPTANVHFRRAIALGVDRSKLWDVFDRSYTPAASFVPQGMLGFSKHAGLRFNARKAREELKASGYDPKTLPPLDLLTVAFDDQIVLAQFIQEELKRNLGLNVRIHNLEPKRYYSPSLVHTDYALQINFWGADFPDSDNFFSIFTSNSGLNRYHWTNERYDSLVVSARSLPSRQARSQAYLQAQRLLIEDSVATVPLYYGRIHGLVRSYVRGFNPGSMNWWDFKDLSLH